jgi:hypothetical protein
MLRHSISKVSEHYLASMDMEKMWEINEGLLRNGVTVSGSFARILYILISCLFLAGSFLNGVRVITVMTIPGLIVPTITGPFLTSFANASLKYLTARFDVP